MASRLGPEGSGAKWADIEDDDDDWVPEVLEKWSDSPRPSLSGNEAEFNTQSPPNAELPQVEHTSPPRTPLPIAAKEEPRPKTLVTDKGVPKPAEKPTLSTAHASPWAKVPTPPIVPIAMNLPQSQFVEPPRREIWTDSPAPPSSGPAMAVKEVSADSYGRTWRESNHVHNPPGPRERELFNSETGQLEPVHESWNRAPRPRTEVSMNKPLVLQRPSGPPPPAEPSPAFQQQRGSMMHHRPDEYRRRRTSSNVSGGSGSTGRRPSFSRFAAEQPLTPEDGRFPPRSGSLNHSPADVYQDPNLNQSIVPRTEPPIAAPKIEAPIISLGADALAGAGAGGSQLPSHSTPAPVPQVPFEDPLAKQERIMKESRELARKRIKEEEAQEEAARRERLKAKIAELERVQKEKEEKENALRKAAEEAEKKAEEERKLVEDRVIAEKAAEAKRAAEENESKKADEAAERLLNSRTGGAYGGARGQSPGASTPNTAPQGRRSLQPMQNRSPNKNFAVPAGAKDQPWKNVPAGNDRFTSWGGSSNQSASPWGVNGVGNGTFDNRYPGFSPGPRPLQSRDERRSSRGAPIPPSSVRGGISQEDRTQAVSRWNALPEKLVEDEAEQRKKSREEHLARQAEEALTGVKRAPQVQPKIVETWRKVELSDDQGEVNRKFVAVKKIQHEETEATDAKQTAVREPTITPPDTKKDGSLTESQPRDHRMLRTQNIPTGPAGSRSRFFPTAASHLIAQHLGSGTEARDGPILRRLSPPGSPPPPMSAEHPVHGDIHSRVVQLPPPLSQVPERMPPPGPHGHSKAEQPKSPRVSSGTQAFEAVQQKILGMTQKHSPTQQVAQIQSPQVTQIQSRPLKTVVSKDFSSTKPLYEVSQEGAVSGPVTVSLPGQTDGGDDYLYLLDPNSLSVLSKPDDEELLHELFDRDFGSTPTVKIPHLPPQIFPDDPMRWIPVAPKSFRRPNIRWQLQTTDIFSAFGTKDFINEAGRKFIPVHLPGGTPVEVPYRGVGRSMGPRRGYPQRGYRNSYGRHGFYNTHNSGNPGYMGRSSNNVGRRIADPVQ